MVEIWAIPIWNGHSAGTYCSVQPGNRERKIRVLSPLCCLGCDVLDVLLLGFQFDVHQNVFDKTRVKQVRTT